MRRLNPFIIVALFCCLFVAGAFSWAWLNRGPSLRQPTIHVHQLMEYKMMGRMHADTLCVWPDTALVSEGNHRPVPAVLSGVAGQTMDHYQIIIDKPF